MDELESVKPVPVPTRARVFCVRSSAYTTLNKTVTVFRNNSPI